MAKVKLIQLDGKLPNLAIMKLAHWHRAQGDFIHFTTSTQPDLFTKDDFDTVYASAIFTYSTPKLKEVKAAYPHAITGGTGAVPNTPITVEDVIGQPVYEHYDYSIYPDYPWSLGFTQRGCRLSCGFCVVPAKEGKPKPVNTIHDIWRQNTPKCVLLLDNDFFGQPSEHWRARIKELQDGNFRANFSQGINARLLNQETAEALASIEYRDDQFKRRRLYIAWDNLNQEKIVFKGIEHLDNAGIPPKHLMVYMLTGYKPGETMEEVMYRYLKLVGAGCKPYPMVYGTNPVLKAFQRWVVGRYAQFIPWETFRHTAKQNQVLKLDKGVQQLKTDKSITVITRDFNQALAQTTDLYPSYREYIDALNKATDGMWSVEYATDSSRQPGLLSEVIRTVISMGDSPTITVTATVTIHTNKGPITRQGTAHGNEDQSTDVRRAALTDAITTLRTAPVQ